MPTIIPPLSLAVFFHAPTILLLSLMEIGQCHQPDASFHGYEHIQVAAQLFIRIGDFHFKHSSWGCGLL